MDAVAVLGTGLIGASLGIALRGTGRRVSGWDPSPAALDKATSIGAVDRPASSALEAVSGADLVVLAAPVGGVLETIAWLRTDALVTDVAGVKLPVVRAARHLAHFVGGHPMAGREVSGPDGASGSLFRGATWVLTTDDVADDDLARMRGVVEEVGAVPVEMTAERHDTAVAAASHLPHLAAAALVARVAAADGALDMAAGGFRDLTRVAMSDPGWWVDVLLANRDAVVPALEGLCDELASLAETIRRRDAGSLERRLAESRAVRTGMSAPAATVGVLLEDRPGEVARVGHALAESGVDLRDLQLRHATHGGGGVLTLSVRAAEAARLRRALEADGFRLVETA